MIAKGPAVPTALATAIIGAVLGGVIGFYGRAAQEKPGGSSGSGPAARSAGGGMGAMGGGGGGMGAMGGGMGGPGGGQQASPSRDLTRLVRNLGTLEKVQSKGLTAEQKKALVPVLTKLKSADKLTDEDCKAQLDAIDKTLTPDQQDALKALTPARGGWHPVKVAWWHGAGSVIGRQAHINQQT